MAIINFKHAEYVAYFEGVATSHIDLQHTSVSKHFSRLNINEMIQSLNSEINYPCLLLENFEGRLDAPSDDQINDAKTGGFMLLDLADLEDYTAQDEKLDAMFALGMEVLSKMRKDRKQFSWLNRLDLDKVKYYKVGPLFDCAFGYLFEFEIKTPLNLAYNPAKWL